MKIHDIGDRDKKKKDNWAKGTDAGKSLNVNDLELGNIFNMVSYNILLSKKERKGLLRQIIAWMKYSEDHWVQNKMADVNST